MARKVQASAPAVRFRKKSLCGSNGRPVRNSRKPGVRTVAQKKAAARVAAKKFRDNNRDKVTAAKRAVRAEFSFSARSYGLTYSRAPCIHSAQELFDWLQTNLGFHHLTVCEEAHAEEGAVAGDTKHFHCAGKLDRVLKFTGADHFDYTCHDGTTVYHPNIIVSGKGWERYCRKGGNFVTNIPESPQVMRDALAIGTLTGSLNYIMQNDPNTYVRFANSLESNLMRHYRRTKGREMPRFAGPYPASRFPVGWNPYTHALHVYGPTGAGKTCYCMHLLRELFGVVEVCKGHIESMKSLTMTNPFLFDEIMCLNEEAATSREITDVVCGGTVHARYCPIDIPPNLPRIFVSNSRWVFKNPDESVYGRRLFQFEFLPVAPIEEWRLVPPPPLTPRMPVDAPMTPRLELNPPRSPRSPSPPPPPPGSPPPGHRSPPRPPPRPYPGPGEFDDRDHEYLSEPEAEPEPRTLLQRWLDDDTAMYPAQEAPVALSASPVFSPGWDFLLPFDDLPVSVDPLADTLEF